MSSASRHSRSPPPSRIAPRGSTGSAYAHRDRPPHSIVAPEDSEPHPAPKSVFSSARGPVAPCDSVSQAGSRSRSRRQSTIASPAEEAATPKGYAPPSVVTYHSRKSAAPSLHESALLTAANLQAHESEIRSIKEKSVTKSEHASGAGRSASRHEVEVIEDHREAEKHSSHAASKIGSRALTATPSRAPSGAHSRAKTEARSRSVSRHSSHAPTHAEEAASRSRSVSRHRSAAPSRADILSGYRAVSRPPTPVHEDVEARSHRSQSRVSRHPTSVHEDVEARSHYSQSRVRSRAGTAVVEEAEVRSRARSNSLHSSAPASKVAGSARSQSVAKPPLSHASRPTSLHSRVRSVPRSASAAPSKGESSHSSRHDSKASYEEVSKHEETFVEKTEVTKSRAPTVVSSRREATVVAEAEAAKSEAASATSRKRAASVAASQVAKPSAPSKAPSRKSAFVEEEKTEKALTVVALAKEESSSSSPSSSSSEEAKETSKSPPSRADSKAVSSRASSLLGTWRDRTQVHVIEVRRDEDQVRERVYNLDRTHYYPVRTRA